MRPAHDEVTFTHPTKELGDDILFTLTLYAYDYILILCPYIYRCVLIMFMVFIL